MSLGMWPHTGRIATYIYADDLTEDHLPLGYH